MLKAIILGISISFIFLFDKKVENIFIILSTLLFYKYVIMDKIEIKHIIYSIIISIIAINIITVFGCRNYFYKDQSKIKTSKDEKLVLLVYEGESKSYNIRERSMQIYFEEKYKGLYNGLYNLNKYKRYYSEQGKSDFKSNCEEIKEEVKKELSNEYIVMNAYIYSEPYLENMISVAIQEGYKEIIICPILNYREDNYKILNERFNNIDLVNRNSTSISITKPIVSDYEYCIDKYVESILYEAKKYDRDIGILITGFENDDIERNLEIRQKLECELKQHKKKEKIDVEIRSTYIHNNSIKNALKSTDTLIERGVEKIYLIAPTVLIDTIDMKYDIERIENILKEDYIELDHYNLPSKNEMIAKDALNSIQNIKISK